MGTRERRTDRRIYLATAATIVLLTVVGSWLYRAGHVREAAMPGTLAVEPVRPVVTATPTGTGSPVATPYNTPIPSPVTVVRSDPPPGQVRVLVSPGVGRTAAPVRPTPRVRSTVAPPRSTPPPAKTSPPVETPRPDRMPPGALIPVLSDLGVFGVLASVDIGAG